MQQMDRRQFNKTAATLAVGALLAPIRIKGSPLDGTEIMTVRGPIKSSQTGICLSHEHIILDFTGSGERGVQRLRKRKVLNTVLPLMGQIKSMGVRTFFDCTPENLGRNPKFLKKISKKTGIHIVSNTGYYGANSNKFLPVHATVEPAEQLAARWTRDWYRGMGGTRIKPGFIKIGVDMGPLSDMHRKLVRAAAMTHRETGMTIAAHTGTAEGAFDELKVLAEEGVAAEALIWVHAQEEKNTRLHVSAAKMGTWVSFDNINVRRIDKYVDLLMNMKRENILSRALISHDGGWYHPGESMGGVISGYTAIFTDLVPALKQKGFSQSEIDQLLIENPANAYAIRKRLTR